MTKIINREALREAIGLADGEAVALLGEGAKEAYAPYLTCYRCKDGMEEDTRFVLLTQDKDGALFAQRAADKGIPFAFAGDNPIFLPYGVLWRGRKPFFSKLFTPSFCCLEEEISHSRSLASLSALLVCFAEDQTRILLDGGKMSDTYPFWEVLEQDFSEESLARLGNLPLPKRQADGYFQTQAALSLLLAKEEKKWNEQDRAILVADFVANVYNSYVTVLPYSIFPPDNGARRDALSEFFGALPCVRPVKSEYEVRLAAFRIRKVREELVELWSQTARLTAAIKRRYSFFAKDGGFCLEADKGEDIKFAMFFAPDILGGDTVLSLIKDSGAADAFL